MEKDGELTATPLANGTSTTVPILMRARDAVWVPIDFTAYTTDMHDTLVGMWALDSEDADMGVR